MINEIPNERFELIPCPVCGSQSNRLFFKIRYGDLERKKSLDYSALGITENTVLFVKKCSKCLFVFVNPRIKPKFEHIVYNDCKKNMYMNKKWLKKIDSKEFTAEALKRKMVRVRPLLAALSYLNLDNPLTLFDYGCGLGHSMSLARELGIDSYGVDISKEVLSICDSLGLKAADPVDFDKKYPDIRADIILFQDTIEHIVDLPATMDYLRQKCKKDTVLYVNAITPRLISFEKKRKHFVKAHFVEHLNFFTIKTLDHLMGRYGFSPLPRVRISNVSKFKDIIMLFGGFVLYNIGLSLTSSFERMYRYNPRM